MRNCRQNDVSEKNIFMPFRLDIRQGRKLTYPTTIAKIAIHVFLAIVLKQDGTMVFSRNQISVVARLYIEFGRFHELLLVNGSDFCS